MDSIRSGRHPDQRRVELRREQVVDVARGMTLIGVVPHVDGRKAGRDQ
jgi:hypothetical protein